MMNEYDNISPSRPRSMTQPPSPVSSSMPPPVYSSLPPLSPSSSSFRRKSLRPPIPVTKSNSMRVSSHALPPRKSHKRSNSDNTGIKSMIPQSTPAMSYSYPELTDEETMKELSTEFMNLNNNNVSNRDNHDVENLMITISDSEGENNAKTVSTTFKRRTGKDIEPLRRHYRSVSMESCFNDLLKSKSPRGKVSSTSSVDGNENLEFGNGEYTADEVKKIVACTKLMGLASDPKRVKRMIANRESAARSKQRKSEYLINLARRVQTLENGNTSMSEKITLMEKENMMMMNENEVMRIRLEWLEQQTQLRDAWTEKLREEIERLTTLLNEQESVEGKRVKMSTSEVMRNRDQSNRSTMQPMDPNMYQQLTINQYNQPQTDPFLYRQI